MYAIESQSILFHLWKVFGFTLQQRTGDGMSLPNKYQAEEKKGVKASFNDGTRKWDELKYTL